VVAITTGWQRQRHNAVQAGVPRGDDPPSEVRLVEPMVVEVSADVAIDRGVLRHPVRFIRVRVDLTREDLARP
jgi:hypothetical protein